MNHQDFKDLIPFYIAQSLKAEQATAFEKHLATCANCQHEIEDWRVVASAVWREADDAARSLPPLSQEVYNRLAYRDKPLTSRYEANPPRPKTARPSAPTKIEALPKRKLQIPVTMVAGFVVAILFGAFLLIMALRQPEENLVALHLTQANDGTSEAYLSAQDATETPNNVGVIPPNGETITPQGTNLFHTNTPEPTNTPPPTTQAPVPLPTNTIAQSQSIQLVPPATSYVPPTATNSPEAPAPLGGGPYVTITPQVFSEGFAYCEIFNPTSVGIEIYSQANYNAEVTGLLLPSEQLRVLVMSIEGWYFVVKPSLERGWIAPAFAYLRGACYATDLPIATATLSSSTPVYETDSGRVAVVNAAYADLQSAPNFSSAVYSVASRNEQFPILGLQGEGSNRFINVMMPDGRSAWLWSEIVIIYPANEAPPTPSPQP